MLVVKLSQMIREKVSQSVEKSSGGAHRYQSAPSLAQECQGHEAFPGPMGPGPHPRYRMISYDDMMLAD